MDSQLPCRKTSVCGLEWCFIWNLSSYLWSTTRINTSTTSVLNLHWRHFRVNLSPGSKLVLYADNVLLYRPISSVNDYQMLQADIDALSIWSTLTFNTSKCKTMLISRKKCSCLPPIPLSVNGTILEVVPTFNYLGVLLSSDLSWSSHIQGVCNKARKILGLMCRRYYQYSDSRILCQLYLSLVWPHLDYAAQIWDLNYTVT